ncbi:MAG: hypothetical protein EAX95_05485 [Candidatus Thorarchaeota archaeon]|nr:hypothetical protein [Candidatus Thorarchaeota archaeon]
MAEQFLSRLNELEKRIDTLAQSLERMMAFMAAIPELQNEMKSVRSEVKEALKSTKAGSAGNEKVEAMYTLVKGQFDEIGGLIAAAVEAAKDQLMAAVVEIPAAVASRMPAEAPAAVAPKAAAKTKSAAPPPEPAKPEPEIVVTPVPEAPEIVQIPADRAMKIAEQLEAILGSLKMGCIAGDVLEQMDVSKSEILKIVPSDPIMVKIDKWAGLVSSYPKRNELQARDILKLKKDLREEIPKYTPA